MKPRRDEDDMTRTDRYYIVKFRSRGGLRCSERFDALADAIKYAKAARREMDSGAEVIDSAEGALQWPSARQIAAGHA